MQNADQRSDYQQFKLSRADELNDKYGEEDYNDLLMQSPVMAKVQFFSKFVNQVEKADYEQYFQVAAREYCLHNYQNIFTPTQAKETFAIISSKFAKSKNEELELRWWENELKLFIWVLVCYCANKNVKIQQLTSEDWLFFSILFPDKRPELFQYESTNLLKQNPKSWEQLQDSLFSNLVQNNRLKFKWSELAKALFIESDKKYFKTPKQCRQRWLNHLDPNKCKKKWQVKEDYLLLNYVKENGKRWAEVSKLLKNRRNQHSIKNRCKSLLTKENKLHEGRFSEAQLIDCLIRKYRLNIKNSKKRKNKSAEEELSQKQEKQAKMLFEPKPTNINQTPSFQLSIEGCMSFPTFPTSFTAENLGSLPEYSPFQAFKSISSFPQFQSSSLGNLNMNCGTFKNMQKPYWPNSSFQDLKQESSYSNISIVQKQKQLNQQNFQDPFTAIEKHFKHKRHSNDLLQ